MLAFFLYTTINHFSFHLGDEVENMDLLWLISLFVFILLSFWFSLAGMTQIGTDEVGVVTKKRSGRSMPQGHAVARNGEMGVQAKILRPGFYWMVPFLWAVSKYPITQISPNEIGILESIDGQPLPEGALVCDGRGCDHPQIDKLTHGYGNEKYRPICILHPGIYRINPFALKIVKGRIVNDIGQSLKEIETGGGRTIMPKMPVGIEGHVAYIVDPNGILMGLFEPSSKSISMAQDEKIL